MIYVERNVAYGQWANCLAYLHIGATCYVLEAPRWLRRLIRDFPNRWYGTGFEIMTECRTFRFRRGGLADDRARRVRRRQEAAELS